MLSLTESQEALPNKGNKMKASKPELQKGAFGSRSWIYRGVSIDKSKRGYFFRTRTTDGFGIGYKGDSFKNLSAVAIAIDEMLSREDVTVDCQAIVILKAVA